MLNMINNTKGGHVMLKKNMQKKIGGASAGATSINPIVKQNRGLLARGVGKAVVVVAGVAFVIVNVVACKKPCDKQAYTDPKTGIKYEVRGDDKNCYYEAVGKEPKDCSGLYVLYTNAQTGAAADSMNVVNVLANWWIDAPGQFQGLVAYYMGPSGGNMTEAQALETVFNYCRDNLDNPEMPDDLKTYVETYFGLVVQFEQAKKDREKTYADWQDCENYNK